MAQPNIDAKIIKVTQDTLGKIIRKPVLTEKLLKRPPFKFLQDIITNIITTTGFMKDLYSPDDLNPNNQKDKDAKIAFLQKAIDAVVSTLGKPVDAKAAKIVAGLEPEKTNQFLQLLAKAAIISGRKEKANSSVKTSNRPDKPTTKESSDQLMDAKRGKKESSIERTKTTSSRVSAVKRPSDKSSGKPTLPGTASKRPSAAVASKSSEPLDYSELQSQIELSDNSREKNDVVDSEEPNQNLDNQITEEKKKDDNYDNDNHDMNTKPEDLTEKATGQSTLREVVGNQSETHAIQKDGTLPQLMVRPPTGTQQQYSPRATPRPSARPTTARAAPPKVVTKKELTESPNNTDFDESRVLQSSEPVENLITDKGSSQQNDNDEDELFIVQEAKDDESSEQSNGLISRSLAFEDDSKKGSLVKQLIETKTALEKNVPDTVDSRSDNNGLQRLASRDIGKLRENIQRLTQIATPLGRILDYLQEDINSIVTELRGWQEEHAKNTARLQEERSSIDTHLEPFRIQLEHLDTEISRLNDSISTRKATIIRNEEKIERIIRTAVERTSL